MAWLKAVVLIYFTSICYNVGANTNKLNEIISSGDLVFHDLSHEFDSNTIYWPKVTPFDFTKKLAENTEYGWYASNDFEAGEHGGTHMDAPYHFHKDGKFVGEIPLDKLIVPLIIVDISSLVNGNPDFVLQKHHLDYLLNDNNGKPCMIIFKFGWSRFYDDKNKYMGINEANDTLNFPGLSQEIAEWITTAHKNVVGVGIDTASLDPGSSLSFPAHRTFLATGIYGMENVKLDVPLPDYGCTGIAMPMKIAKGTGGPLRLAALCPKTTPTQF